MVGGKVPACLFFEVVLCGLFTAWRLVLQGTVLDDSAGEEEQAGDGPHGQVCVHHAQSLVLALLGMDDIDLSLESNVYATQGGGSLLLL